jgi:hypothetical protein
MKSNIYIKSLEIGYKKLDGVSFNELINIINNHNLNSNKKLLFYFNIWFYNNFHNENAEPTIIRHNTSSNVSAQLTFKDWTFLERYNDEKSYIKGDSVSKYIDYLELRESRISSSRAFKISIISVIIACLSVIAQVIFSNNFPPSKNIKKSENRNKTFESKFDNSDSLKLRKSKMDKTEYKRSYRLNNENPKNDTLN